MQCCEFFKKLLLPFCSGWKSHDIKWTISIQRHLVHSSCRAMWPPARSSSQLFSTLWTLANSCKKKKRYSTTCNSMDGPWRHYAKRNKPLTEWQILPDATYEVSMRVKVTQSKGGVMVASGCRDGTWSPRSMGVRFQLSRRNELWGCAVQQGTCRHRWYIVPKA